MWLLIVLWSRVRKHRGRVNLSARAQWSAFYRTREFLNRLRKLPSSFASVRGQLLYIQLLWTVQEWLDGLYMFYSIKALFESVKSRTVFSFIQETHVWPKSPGCGTGAQTAVSDCILFAVRKGVWAHCPDVPCWTECTVKCQPSCVLHGTNVLCNQASTCQWKVDKMSSLIVRARTAGTHLCVCTCHDATHWSNGHFPGDFGSVSCLLNLQKDSLVPVFLCLLCGQIAVLLGPGYLFLPFFLPCPFTSSYFALCYFFPFFFSLYFANFLLLSIPFLSIWTVPLHFQAGGPGPNLGLVSYVHFVLSVLLS